MAKTVFDFAIHRVFCVEDTPAFRSQPVRIYTYFFFLLPLRSIEQNGLCNRYFRIPLSSGVRKRIER